MKCGGERNVFGFRVFVSRKGMDEKRAVSVQLEMMFEKGGKELCGAPEDTVKLEKSFEKVISVARGNAALELGRFVFC